jgi:hypothetical protein
MARRSIGDNLMSHRKSREISSALMSDTQRPSNSPLGPESSNASLGFKVLKRENQAYDVCVMGEEEGGGFAILPLVPTFHARSSRASSVSKTPSRLEEGEFCGMGNPPFDTLQTSSLLSQDHDHVA